MKITALYVYPIKALRGIPLERAQLGPQGIRHDRRFMLFHVVPGTGELKSMQLARYPRCALFEQDLVGNKILVKYHPPDEDVDNEATAVPLEVPLEPDVAALETVQVELHRSPASTAYAMGQHYDDWFSRHLGISAILVYIGDGKRPVLGSAPPQTAPASSPPPWITFTDVAPFLVTSEASLRDVHARFPGGEEVAMYKFRPNIVVSGESAWAEDFWGELALAGGDGAVDAARPGRRIVLTANCGRCASLNVDYQTGRPAKGELGKVLKKLMADRRVDAGYKYSPVFGRYGFLVDAGEVSVAVGDTVEVTERRTERTKFEWPGLA